MSFRNSRVPAKQAAFAANLARLLLWIKDEFPMLDVTIGEVERTAERQRELVEKGLSKTHNSLHLSRLAADLHFYKWDAKIGAHVFMDESTEFQQNDLTRIGDYWKSLSDQNVWGGDWGWDHCHFQGAKR